MFLVFHEIFRLAVLINFVLIKKKECMTLKLKGKKQNRHFKKITGLKLPDEDEQG